eukprot:NODE_144_length_17694_cov_0.489741.p1 type:complete len:1083 gc:universal NODE_144_length_17694_cov_0.489741:6165-2917(-)
MTVHLALSKIIYFHCSYLKTMQRPSSRPLINSQSQPDLPRPPRPVAPQRQQSQNPRANQQYPSNQGPLNRPFSQRPPMQQQLRPGMQQPIEPQRPPMQQPPSMQQQRPPMQQPPMQQQRPPMQQPPMQQQRPPMQQPPMQQQRPPMQQPPPLQQQRPPMQPPTQRPPYNQHPSAQQPGQPPNRNSYSQSQQQLPQFGQQPTPPMPQQPIQPPFGQPTPNTPPFSNSPQYYAGTQQQLPSPNPPRKIDPSQVPSPISVEQLDYRDEFLATFDPSHQSSTNPINPDRSAIVPLTTTICHMKDMGNCIPRYMRCSTSIPVSDEFKQKCQIPLGLIVHPLVDNEYDEEILTVDTRPFKGPVRCNKCRAYMCPRMSFTNGGKSYVCGFCTFQNTVPTEYFCNLDMNHVRMDIQERHELTSGTIDITVSDEYIGDNEPLPLAIIFAIDTSINSYKSGQVQSICACLLKILYNISSTILEDVDNSRDFYINGLSNGGIDPAYIDTSGIAGNPQFQLPQNAKIAIMTFDSELIFYTNNGTSIVIPDVNDVFYPSNDIYLDPIANKQQIRLLLEQIPLLIPTSNHSCIASAIIASSLALQQRGNAGGKCVMFHSILPNHGPGILANRDASLVMDKKNNHLYPPDDMYYQQLAKDLIKRNVCLDVFSFPTAYVDLATIGHLCTKTGGSNYFFPGYTINDSYWLFSNLFRNLTKPFGYQGYLRVRSSLGVQVHSYMGSLHSDDDVECKLCGVDADKSVAVLLAITNQMNGGLCNLQSALLYTTPSGLRKVRINTLAVPIEQQAQSLFKHGECDTVVSILGKFSVQSTTIQEGREELMTKTSKTLAMYRKHCAMNSPPGQLILPESLKLLPCYVLCLLKSKSFTLQQYPLDFRVNHMRFIGNCSTEVLMPFLYPRIYDLVNLPDNVGEFDDMRLILPNRIRASMELFMDDGCYLIENGQRIYIWIGRSISKSFLMSVFNVNSIDQINVLQHSLKMQNNAVMKKLSILIGEIYRRYRKYIAIYIVRSNVDPLEQEIKQMMVEDMMPDGPSYVDFLISLHRTVQQEVIYYNADEELTKSQKDIKIAKLKALTINNF